jgi:hypothetical protein
MVQFLARNIDWFDEIGVMAVIPSSKKGKPTGLLSRWLDG